MTCVLAVAFANELHIYAADDPCAVVVYAVAEAHGVDASLHRVTSERWDRVRSDPRLRGVEITDHRKIGRPTGLNREREEETRR